MLMGGFPGEQKIQDFPSCRRFVPRQSFGLRWQSAAATPLSALPVASKSGVALRFPPQSKICGYGFVAPSSSVPIRGLIKEIWPRRFSPSSQYPRESSS
jgi:hypothetical protein